MVKQIFMIKRKSGMSFEDFKKHYLEVHVPLVKKVLPEVRKYITNYPLQRGKEAPFDAITEIWWDDIATIVKVAKSDVYRDVILPDEAKFINRESEQVVLTEEFIHK